MNKDLTEVVFILDKSGSMSGLEKDVVGGFNSTIRKQKEEKGECIISTVLFDDEAKVIHDRISINEVKEMNLNDYYPSGCTALVDTLANSIKYIKKVHKIIREEDRPAKTLFIITTDGYENASHKYSSDDLKKMVKAQNEAGWEFIYLAANIDAVETGTSYGFKKENNIDFVCDSVGNQKVFASVSRAVSNARLNVKESIAETFEEVAADFVARGKK